jgi:hypothetical protein
LGANNKGLFEPSGGSAPDIAGKDIANPIAMIHVGGNDAALFAWPPLPNLWRVGRSRSPRRRSSGISTSIKKLGQS